ncbi:MAG TPA: hypothetical protein VNA28_13520 [Solirubrobacteraceae bacterium]|nr:hypothetical protein [Solirubrobacteraceae bacterium]
MSRRLLAASVVVALPAAAALACGTPSPDLFVVKRDGNVPGAKLELLVSDQTARCNDGPVKRLSSEQILEARDIRDDLIEVQEGIVQVPALPRAQIFSFVVTTEMGDLRFSDTAQRPPIFPRVSRFTRRVAIDTCGLER